MARPALARDDNNQSIPLTPARIALARTVNATLSSSQSIALNTLTTMIRCYAVSQDVFLKWGTTAVTNANFDEVIPAGQIVDLVVPVDSSGTAYTALRLIERNASASIIVIEK